jgi:hypothetical protein
MPLDTRIALGVQPLQVQFRDPIAGYNQLAQLQSADTQNQLAQMQMSAAQRAMQEEEGAKSFLSGNPDLSIPENQRRLLAFGKTGLAYGKAISEQQKSKGEADKTAAEVLGLTQKNFTAINPPIRAAAGGIPGITAYVEAMYKDPVLGALAARVKTKEQALKENIEMYTKDPDQWVTAHSNLEGAQMLEALKTNAERAAERARISSLPPLPGAAPTGTVNDARAALAAPGAAVAPAGIDQGTIDIAPDVRIDAKFQSQIVDKLKNYGETASLKEFPGMRWTLSPSGLLTREPIPINALAPTAAAAGNVNAMVAPTGNEATLQAISVETKKLNDRLDVLDRMPFSKGKEDETKRIEARLKELTAPINLRADGAAIIPGKGILTAAAAPSDILRLQREEAALRASGDVKGAEVIANRVKKLNELTDNRSETQKEVAVLADPNASKEAKEAATKRIAKLVDIPAKSVDGAIERYEYAKKNSGYKGSFTDFVVLSTPKTTVSIDAGQKAEEVEFGKYVVDQYKEVSARADVATRSLPALDINLKTLEKGFDTGFGTETIAAGAKVLAALGVQNAKDFATDSQTFLANANSAVLQKQLEQKGVQTAADADRITSTGAQLGNTKEANKFILSVAKAQLQRDIAQRKFYSEWRDENKTFKGAEDAWYAGPGSVSLFDSPILKKYAEPVAGQSEARNAGLDKIFKKAP